MKMLRTVALAAAALLLAFEPAAAQWATPNHSVPVGRGAGIIGFGSVVPGPVGSVLTSTGLAADPTFQLNSVATVIDCHNATYNVKGDNSTNDSTAWAACITAANAAAPNVTMLVPVGISLAPTLSSTITGNNVWVKCVGAPGDCVLKGGSNNVITWTGNFGGTYNMGVDNTGASSNVTFVANGFGQQFLNTMLNTGIGSLLTLGAGGSTALVNNLQGNANNTATVPLFPLSQGAGFTLMNSSFNLPTPPTLGSGRGVVNLSGGFDSVLLVNNFPQNFDYWLNVTVASGQTAQNIFSQGNIVAGMNTDYTFISNGTGSITSGAIADKFIQSVAGACLTLAGAGSFQGFDISGGFNTCATSGVLANTTTMNDVQFHDIHFEGVNTTNSGSATYVLEFPGGATQKNISVQNVSGGFAGVESSFQPTHGFVAGTAMDHLSLIGNNFQGSTDSYSGQTLAHTNSLIANNIGMPAVVATITVTASPFTYTANARPETVFVAGGTVSAISQDGVGLPGLTSGAFTLGPYETLTVTYTAAPTLTTVRH